MEPLQEERQSESDERPLLHASYPSLRTCSAKAAGGHAGSGSSPHRSVRGARAVASAGQRSAAAGFPCRTRSA